MRTRRRERVIVVGVDTGARAPNSLHMEELVSLVESAGGEVVGQLVQRRPERRAHPMLGKGKVAELAALCDAKKAELVVTNHDLSPIQLKGMEDAIPCRVVDRTTLILDIFSQRARSREGQLQVELAQHLYRLPRLRGRGKELSRLGASMGGGTAGARGAGMAGGMVGTRGPGEQELEYDRRRIRRRMGIVKREIESLRERRGQQRARRREMLMPSIVLVGYTNAGKSTLFNAVSHANAITQNKMFSTLDPQVRQLHFPGGGRALLSDTVGFIDELPRNLRVAFHATLEEISAADVLIHVADASHPELSRQVMAVKEELRLMGAENIPTLTLMNKMDLVSHRAGIEPLAAELAPSVLISAREKKGIECMLAELEELLRASVWIRVVFENPTIELRNQFAAMGISTREVRGTGDDTGNQSTSLEAWLAPAHAARLEREGIGICK